MTDYAVRRLRYAVWDGANLDAIAEFLPSAYVGEDGNVWIPTFGGAQVTEAIGNVVVEPGTAPGFERYDDEDAFRAAYQTEPTS